MICEGFGAGSSADMHYSFKVSGGSQVGPSLSVQTDTLKRLSRMLGLARRGGRVNAILDKCLMLSEIGVSGPDNESSEYTHASLCRDWLLGILISR